MPVILASVQTSLWFFNFQIQLAQCLNPQPCRFLFILKNGKGMWQATSSRGRINKSIKPMSVVPSAPYIGTALITADLPAGSISCPWPGPWINGGKTPLGWTNGTSLLVFTREVHGCQLHWQQRRKSTLPACFISAIYTMRWNAPFWTESHQETVLFSNTNWL